MNGQVNLVDNIRSIIRARGYKQGAVAERAGFSPTAFSNMLNGRKEIKASYIPLICSALNATPNDLFSQPERPSA